MARRGTTAKIDLAELERLSAMQCTDEEIAAWFKVTTRTIERRRKVKRFADVTERGRAKQILSQTDEIRHDISGAFISVCLPREPLIPTFGIEVGSVSGRPLIEGSGRDSEDNE